MMNSSFFGTSYFLNILSVSLCLSLSDIVACSMRFLFTCASAHAAFIRVFVHFVTTDRHFLQDVPENPYFIVHFWHSDVALSRLSVFFAFFFQLFVCQRPFSHSIHNVCYFGWEVRISGVIRFIFLFYLIRIQLVYWNLQPFPFFSTLGDFFGAWIKFSISLSRLSCSSLSHFQVFLRR